MATPEEQLAQLADRVNQLGQLLQQSQERNALLEGRMQGLEAAGGQMGPAIQALATAQTEVANAMKKDEKKINLVDNRGIGKPDKFSGKESESYLRWRIKTESFMFSVFPEMEQVLNWCEEQENTVTEARAQAAFGVGTASPVDDLKDKSAQIYSVLQNLLGRTVHDFEDYRKGQWTRGLATYQPPIRSLYWCQEISTLEAHLESRKMQA